VACQRRGLAQYTFRADVSKRVTWATNGGDEHVPTNVRRQSPDDRLHTLMLWSADPGDAAHGHTTGSLKKMSRSTGSDAGSTECTRHDAVADNVNAQHRGRVVA